MYGNRRKSSILDSMLWIPVAGLRIPCQCNLDSGFLELNSGLQSVSFRIPQEKNSQKIVDSMGKKFLDSGIWITLHGANDTKEL